MNRESGGGYKTTQTPYLEPERRQVQMPANASQRLMQPPREAEQLTALPTFPVLSPIGQLHGTYIVAQNESGLFLIDQHAAHERIHYEYYDASQQLLVPITLDFTPTDAEMLKLKLDLFAQAGVYLEHFGGHSFIIRAYPHWFPSGEEQRIIEEMAEWILTEKKEIDLTKIREKSAILCACKASIKANHSLTTSEMEALLHRLGECKVPYTCPHGRPIIISFSSYELEKMFKRVM
jgi:DNA mismatch repair protein MutL